MKKFKILMIVETTEDGFSAYSVKYPIFTIGKTITELKKNAVNAIEFYFNCELTEENIKFKYKI